MLCKDTAVINGECNCGAQAAEATSDRPKIKHCFCEFVVLQFTI